MATSFAAYASQYLNRQQQQASPSPASSQPLFFSFTTDGSGIGRAVDDDLDDLDDPHLRASGNIQPKSKRDYNAYDIGGSDDGDDDPYLRLDDEELAAGSSKNYNTQKIPQVMGDINDSDESDSPKGWLAHQASPLRRSRSPSPSPPTSSDSSPPPDFFNATTRPPSIPPPPSTSRAPVSLSLTESLLPRDGHSRPIDVFSLPDPRHVSRSRRKFNDSIWTALWCAGVGFCFFFAFLLLFITKTNSRKGLPYTTLLHTVPLLTILTFLSAAVAYSHIFLLQIFVRPVMIATSVFIPATLFISAVWAFIGSFMWEEGQEPTWGETVGLRLFSLVPLALSAYTARRLGSLPRQIHATSATLTLSTQILLAHPLLLALSPAILLTTLLISIPFLTLIFRLLLIGYWPTGAQSGAEWHIRGWAHWAILGGVFVWLWSWGVARGTLRVTCAGVVGAWYFADPNERPPPPMSTHTIHAAIARATQPSLGTISLAALLLTGIRMLTLLAAGLRLLPLYLPVWARPAAAASLFVVGYLEGVTGALSSYALVYTGLTGDPFMVSARRARALTAAAESNGTRRRIKAEPTLAILTVAPLTLTFPFALITYLFVAHTLRAPDSALGAAVLAGGVTALVGLFCVGLVKDTADTLYICYCIDKDLGERKREEVFAAFEYSGRTQPQTAVQRRGRAQRSDVPASAPSRFVKGQTGQSVQTPQPQRQRDHPIDYHPPNAQRLPSTHGTPLAGADASSSSTPSPPLPASNPPPVAKTANVEVKEEDVDPFERSFGADDLPGYDVDDESRGGGGSRLVSKLGKSDPTIRGGARSLTGAGDGDSASAGEEEGGEMLGLFPGSDLF